MTTIRTVKMRNSYIRLMGIRAIRALSTAPNACVMYQRATTIFLQRRHRRERRREREREREREHAHTPHTQHTHLPALTWIIN